MFKRMTTTTTTYTTESVSDDPLPGEGRNPPPQNFGAITTGQVVKTETLASSCGQNVRKNLCDNGENSSRRPIKPVRKPSQPKTVTTKTVTVVQEEYFREKGADGNMNRKERPRKPKISDDEETEIIIVDKRRTSSGSSYGRMDAWRWF